MFCVARFLPAFSLMSCLLIASSLANLEICRSRVHEERVYLTRGREFSPTMEPYRIYHGEVCDNSIGAGCSYIDNSSLLAGYRAVCNQHVVPVHFMVYNYTDNSLIPETVYVPAGCFCELVEPNFS